MKTNMISMISVRMRSVFIAKYWRQMAMYTIVLEILAFTN
jgi:hypothetical protein